MTDTTTTYKCPGCEEEIDTENGCYAYSTVEDREYCESCRDSDLTYASVVTVYGPGYEPDSDGHQRYYIGSLFHEDRWGEEPDLTFQQKWVSTDAWRGYSVTTIEGWAEVIDGWSTGNWGDGTSDRKQPFRDWVEGLHTGEIVPPCPVAVIADTTSNVFSTAIGIFVPEDDMGRFAEWLNGDAEVLKEALS